MDMRLEKRLAPRRNTLIPAQIIFDDQRVNCIIRNISDGGTKLELPGAGHLPRYFLLSAPGFEPHGCRVAWHALREVGVQFIDKDTA